MGMGHMNVLSNAHTGSLHIDMVIGQMFLQYISDLVWATQFIAQSATMNIRLIIMGRITFLVTPSLINVCYHGLHELS